MWCVGTTESFEEAVLAAANLGDDAGSAAALAGQLAGALYGACAIPDHWLEQLAWRDRIAEMADAVFDHSAKRG
jgi:ADP-ribosyl-[dinitrogen reductase] hydrolase